MDTKIPGIKQITINFVISLLISFDEAVDIFGIIAVDNDIDTKENNVIKNEYEYDFLGELVSEINYDQNKKIIYIVMENLFIINK